ncbi:outer membrane protein assembly factor BamB [bacterium]|nr:outer membrane protein assembly factor BamB [bacterium]
MRTSKLSVLLLVALALLIACSSKKKVGKDNVAIPTELKDITSTVKFDKRWSMKVNSDDSIRGERLRPAVASDRVFAAGPNEVRAVSLQSGKALWSNDSAGRWSAGPATDGKRVLVGSVDGQIMALDAADGEVLSQQDVSSEVLAAPAVADDVVVVKTIDGRVRALEASDGKLRWEIARDMPLLTLRGSAAPVIADGYVYIASENGKLSAFDIRNGNPLWEQTVSVSSGRNELERVSDIDGLLGFDKGDLFLAGYNGQTVAVASNTGNSLWSFNAPSVTGLGLSTRAVIVSDSDSEIIALDRRSGTELWRQKGLKHRLTSAPVAIGDYAVVADVEGYLHALSLETGEFSARVQMGSKPITMAPVIAGDIIITQNDSGAVTAFELR